MASYKLIYETFALWNKSSRYSEYPGHSHRKWSSTSTTSRWHMLKIPNSKGTWLYLPFSICSCSIPDLSWGNNDLWYLLIFIITYSAGLLSHFSKFWHRSFFFGFITLKFPDHGIQLYKHNGGIFNVTRYYVLKVFFASYVCQHKLCTLLSCTILLLKKRMVPCIWILKRMLHYNVIIMGTMVSQISGISIVCSIVCLDANQRKHQSSTSLAFVWGGSIHKGPVMQKYFHLMTSLCTVPTILLI